MPVQTKRRGRQAVGFSRPRIFLIAYGDHGALVFVGTPRAVKVAAMRRRSKPAAASFLIRQRLACSRGFGTSLSPSGARSYPKGIFPLIRFPWLRRCPNAPLVRSAI
jgi:hypothetical protein